MIQYKSTANKGVLEPVMMLALSRIERTYNDYGYACVVTSTDDSFHRVGSLHYCGLAVDIRTKNIQEDLKPVIADEVREKLTGLDTRFQVILEKEHLHVEFDRRTK